MLDKILGKKDKDKKDVPDLRKEDTKSDPNIGGRIKGVVSKATDKSKEKVSPNDNGLKKPEGNDSKKEAVSKKMPRPIPKPRKKPDEKPKLKPPKQPKKKSGGLGGGFGRKGSDDDQRTLVGAAVFSIILIVLVGAGYYFLVYQPYQETLGSAKQTKLNEVNAYFKGPLALDPQKQTLTAEIESAETPEQALAVDVMTPATAAWREYQTQEINAQKDPYGRVMITYSAAGQKNLIMKVVDAQTIVNEADASVLANMIIETPDTVAVPIIITRLQAAGGLVNVGDSVDVYLRTTATNETNQTATQTANNTSPSISGATVLAILRAVDSGAVDANLKNAQEVAINQVTMGNSRTTSTSTDVEQLLRAAASGTWDDSTVSSTLSSYGWKLSDFERSSNLGELDVKYLVLLEVPRENALFLMQNQDSIALTVSTQKAPQWMIQELTSIYG
jgi:hypothetical protein